MQNSFCLKMVCITLAVMEIFIDWATTIARMRMRWHLALLVNFPVGKKLIGHPSDYFSIDNTLHGKRTKDNVVCSLGILVKLLAIRGRPLAG